MSDETRGAEPNVPQNAIHIGQQVSEQLFTGLSSHLSGGDAIVTHALALAWAAHSSTEAMRKLLPPDQFALFESALADVQAHAEAHSALRWAQHEQAEAGRAVPRG